MAEARALGKARKRTAVADLRNLASELGCLPITRTPSDLKEPEFAALHRQVKAQCTTPEQERLLSQAWKPVGFWEPPPRFWEPVGNRI